MLPTDSEPGAIPTLVIEITKLGNQFVALTRQSDGREILSNTFQHDLSSPHDLQPDWLVDDPQDDPPDGLRHPDIRPRPNFEQAARDGRRLYRYLFSNGKTLRKHLARYPETSTHYVTLSIDAEAASLWRLPWEYIFDGSAFPCLTGQMLISRRPADLRTLTPQITAPPLQILVVIANPEDQTAFDTAEELDVLHRALEHLVGPGLIHLELLPEPTSYALLEAVRTRPYQVIHFIGHGVYQLAQRQGYLCLENSIGRSELLSGAQLPKYLEGWTPRLFIISTPQKSQVGVFDAFAGVAGALLRHDLPNVLTLPVSLPVTAAQSFFSAFYTTLTTFRSGSESFRRSESFSRSGSSTVIESVHQGRQALKLAEETLPPEQQRLLWGMPSLYQRTPPDHPLVELVHADKGPETSDSGHHAIPLDGDSKQVPPHVWAPVIRSPNPIGRKLEIQAIRRELKAGATIFYLWGSEGVGKRALVSYLLPSLGSHSSATLVIHCREMPEPLAVLAVIADFWRTRRQTGGHAGSLADAPADWRGADPPGTSSGRRMTSEAQDQAAEILLDPRKEPFERARAAQALRAKKHCIIYFAGIDAWFDQETATGGSIQDEILREILLGLLSAPSNTLFFFTGAERWADIAPLNTSDRRDIPLSLLPLEPSIRVMNQYPHLRPLYLDQKRELHRHMGGHPKVLQLLDGLLHLRGGDDGAPQVLVELLALPPGSWRTPGGWRTVEERSTEAWMHVLICSILDHLDPGEQDVLRALALLRQPFSGTTLSALTPIAPQHTAPLIAKWLRLGLIETLRENETWPHSMSRVEDQSQYMMEVTLQRHILADLTEVETKALHLQAAAYYGAPFVDEACRQILARNMSTWSQDRIGWLARDINGILGLWLRRPSDDGPMRSTLSRALAWQSHLRAAGDVAAADHLVGTIAPELNRQGQHDLAWRLLQQAEESTKAQIPHSSGPPRSLHQRTIQEEATIEALRSALEKMRAEGNEAGEAECLHRLAAVYREAADARQALTHSQAAVECYETLAYPYGLASAQSQQAYVLKDLGQLEYALERFAASLRLYRQLDDRPSIAENLMEIGLLFERLGKIEMAIQVIEEAVAHYEYLKNPEYSHILSLLEQLYARQKRIDEARGKVRATRGENEPG